MPPEQLKILLIEHDPGFARYVGEMLGQARDLPAEMRPAADLESRVVGVAGERLRCRPARYLRAGRRRAGQHSSDQSARRRRFPSSRSGIATMRSWRWKRCMPGRRITWSRASSRRPGWNARSAMPSSGTAWTWPCSRPRRNTTASSTTWWKAYSRPHPRAAT